MTIKTLKFRKAAENPALAAKPDHESPAGIPIGLLLKVQKLNARNLSGGDFATGKWDIKEHKWVFESKNEALKDSLEDMFSRVVVGSMGREFIKNEIPINSMSYVGYMKDVILPSKGMTLSWEIKPTKKDEEIEEIKPLPGNEEFYYRGKGKK